MKTNPRTKQQPSIKWQPVSVPFVPDKFESFTLVRVAGWKRLGFAYILYGSTEWSLLGDPALDKDSEPHITHWLQVPLAK